MPVLWSIAFKIRHLKLRSECPPPPETPPAPDRGEADIRRRATAPFSTVGQTLLPPLGSLSRPVGGKRRYPTPPPRPICVAARMRVALPEPISRPDLETAPLQSRFWPESLAAENALGRRVEAHEVQATLPGTLADTASRDGGPSCHVLSAIKLSDRFFLPEAYPRLSLQPVVVRQVLSSPPSGRGKAFRLRPQTKRPRSVL